MKSLSGLTRTGSNYRKALRELERRRKLRPWKYCYGTRPQREFFDSQDFITVFSGGNRSGKTTAGAVKFLKYLHEHPGARGRIASDKELVTEVLIPTLKLWLGNGISEVETWKAGRHFESKWQLRNGSFFDVLTYDQKDLAFAGVELQVLWMDEPPPRSKYKESVARFSKGGQIFFTFTPLIHAAWVYDEIICAGTSPLTPLNPPLIRGEVGKRDIRIVYSDIEDNCIECMAKIGDVGYLHHETIQRILAEYDPEELEARKKGKFLHLAGLVYKKFNYTVHVLDRFSVPKHWNIVQIVDPHDSRPFAAIWMAVNEIGDCYIIDEWPRENFENYKSNPWTLSEILELYRKKEAENNWKNVRRVMDPNFGNVKSNRTGKSIRQEAREKGFNYIEVDDNLEAGHAKVREFLRYNEQQPIDAVNKPKLYVFGDCRNTIHGFTHYLYDPKTGLVQEDYKDFMDCVRYGIMSKPRYVERRIQEVRDSWRARMEKRRKSSRAEVIDY